MHSNATRGLSFGWGGIVSTGSAGSSSLTIDAKGTGNLLLNTTATGNVGIGTATPKSKLDVEGGLAVGATYSGTTAAPANGAIIQGNVGIGTANPTHPLHVVGSTNQVVASHRFGEGGLGDGRQWSVFANYGHNIGIYATESIRTDGVFLASSDKRIKKDIFVSNSKEDLKTIENIEITNYKYINVFEKGDLMQKKVIAQQVEEVYPTAVGKTKSFIPNIYAVAESVETSNTNLVRLSLAEPHGLIKGDIVRIEGKTGGTEQLEVLLVDENSFTVKIEKPQEDYFVFGKQVDDFRVVDYDALTTLNISATQELVKRIEMLEKKNELLEKTNATLRKENSNTDKNYNELKAELEIIKQAVFQYAEK